MARRAVDSSFNDFEVGREEAGRTFASLLKARVADLSWSQARELFTKGFVEVDGEVLTDPARRARGGESVRPRKRSASLEAPKAQIAYEDRHLVMVEKPVGISSVPFSRGERGTLMDRVRAEWRRRGLPPAARSLYVVHRLDRDTSGLIVYARTRAAERALQSMFRRHAVDRAYLGVAHGRVEGGRIESRLVPDRGDGLRGSTRAPDKGKVAITHVRVVEALPGATLFEARLETGRTHQIRIHLAEKGHPLVGERVYLRDYVARGGTLFPSGRLMLHAALLGFDHPIGGERVERRSELPGDFMNVLKNLRRRRRNGA